MTPYERVKAEYDMPFDLRPYQIEAVNDLSTGPEAAYYDEPGAGKTATSTHHMLFRSMSAEVSNWVLLMPPILLTQWAKWLRSIHLKGKPGINPTIYRGTPAQRKELSLDRAFTLMSYQIFKQDFERIYTHFEGKNVGILADEAHVLKNHTTANHKAFYQFSEDRDRIVLTGTPITKPGDAYAYCRLIVPGRYRNKRHFDQLHVEEEDDYGTPTRWGNLDVLAESMTINASRILRREVQSQLPAVQMTPLLYDLAPQHQKLYERIAQERLVEFEDGSEINAISEAALYTSLQQLVVNWPYYSDDEGNRPAVLDLIEEILAELSPHGKLVIAAHFIRTNEYLLQELQKYGAVAIFGGVSAKKREEAIRRFTEDEDCRCIILQPTSAGFGVDGLQRVCSDMLVVEAPTTAPPFHQVVGRLDRDGQPNPVNCRVAIANKTVQVRMFNKLLDNDAVINSVQRGFKDLKEAIFGD